MKQSVRLIVSCVLFFLFSAAALDVDARRPVRPQKSQINKGLNATTTKQTIKSVSAQIIKEAKRVKAEQDILEKETSEVIFNNEKYYVNTKKYPEILFSKESYRDAHEWLNQPIRGPPVVLSLIEPGLRLVQSIGDSLSKSSNGVDFLKIEPTAERIKNEISAAKDRPVIIIAHHVSNEKGSFLSNIAETKQVSWSEIKSYAATENQLVFQLSCRSGQLCGASAGLSTDIFEFEVVSGIQKATEAKTVLEFFQALKPKNGHVVLNKRIVYDNQNQQTDAIELEVVSLDGIDTAIVTVVNGIGPYLPQGRQSNAEYIVGKYPNPFGCGIEDFLEKEIDSRGHKIFEPIKIDSNGKIINYSAKIDSQGKITELVKNEPENNYFICSMSSSFCRSAMKEAKDNASSRSFYGNDFLANYYDYWLSCDDITSHGFLAFVACNSVDIKYSLRSRPGILEKKELKILPGICSK